MEGIEKGGRGCGDDGSKQSAETGPYCTHTHIHLLHKYTTTLYIFLSIKNEENIYYESKI